MQLKLKFAPKAYFNSGKEGTVHVSFSPEVELQVFFNKKPLYKHLVLDSLKFKKLLELQIKC